LVLRFTYPAAVKNFPAVSPMSFSNDQSKIRLSCNHAVPYHKLLNLHQPDCYYYLEVSL